MAKINEASGIEIDQIKFRAPHAQLMERLQLKVLPVNRLQK